MPADWVQLAQGQRERLPPDSPRDGGAHVDEDVVRTGLEGACAGAWGDSHAANGLQGRNLRNSCSGGSMCSIESAGPASAPCPDPPGMHQNAMGCEKPQSRPQWAVPPMIFDMRASDLALTCGAVPLQRCPAVLCCTWFTGGWQWAAPAQLSLPASTHGARHRRSSSEALSGIVMAGLGLSDTAVSLGACST